MSGMYPIVKPKWRKSGLDYAVQNNCRGAFTCWCLANVYDWFSFKGRFQEFIFTTNYWITYNYHLIFISECSNLMSRTKFVVYFVSIDYNIIEYDDDYHFSILEVMIVDMMTSGKWS